MHRRLRYHLLIVIACSLVASACSGESSGSSSNTPYSVGEGTGTAAPIVNQFSGYTGETPSKTLPPPGFGNPQPGAPAFKAPALHGPAVHAPAFRLPTVNVRAPHVSFHIHG
jgi:hypothetical protein